MTSQQNMPKRWRPRFSVRTLTIFMTLVCCYFGAWEATKRWGIKSLDKKRHDGIGSSVPLIVWRDEYDKLEIEHAPPAALRPRRYYLWLLGPTWKLPIESEWKSRAYENPYRKSPKR